MSNQQLYSVWMAALLMLQSNTSESLCYSKVRRKSTPERNLDLSIPANIPGRLS